MHGAIPTRGFCGASHPCSRSPPSQGGHSAASASRRPRRPRHGPRRRVPPQDAARRAIAAMAGFERPRDRVAPRRRMRVARQERRPSHRCGHAQSPVCRGCAAAVDAVVHPRRPADQPRFVDGDEIPAWSSRSRTYPPSSARAGSGRSAGGHYYCREQICERVTRTVGRTDDRIRAPSIADRGLRNCAAPSTCRCRFSSRVAPGAARKTWKRLVDQRRGTEHDDDDHSSGSEHDQAQPAGSTEQQALVSRWPPSPAGGARGRPAHRQPARTRYGSSARS